MRSNHFKPRIWNIAVSCLKVNNKQWFSTRQEIQKFQTQTLPLLGNMIQQNDKVMVPNLSTPAKLELSARLQQEQGRVEQMNSTLGTGGYNLLLGYACNKLAINWTYPTRLESTCYHLEVLHNIVCCVNEETRDNSIPCPCHTIHILHDKIFHHHVIQSSQTWEGMSPLVQKW